VEIIMLMRKTRRRAGIAVTLVALAVLAALLSPVRSAMAHTSSGMAMAPRKAAQPCASTQPLGCADSASAAFSSDGALLLTWTQDAKIYFARSEDTGQHWTLPVRVGDAGAAFDGGGDARPQVASDAAGHVLIAYDTFKDDSWNAQIWLASSADGGVHFDAPRVFEPEGVSQRLPVLDTTPSGRILMAWQDKRRSGPKKLPGASIAYAWSDDGGRSFSPSAIAADVSCECCRIGVANSGDGTPVLAFRTIFPGDVRDHVILHFSSSGAPEKPLRVARDEWATASCPHHGPSIAISSSGAAHVVWYTQGKARQGLFYGRSADAGQSFDEPMRLGEADDAVSRPYVYAQGEQVWRAWKQYDGQASRVLMQHSSDEGKAWSEPRVLSRSTGRSDHPLLLGYRHRVFLSWLSSEHGYQLIDLKE